MPQGAVQLRNELFAPDKNKPSEIKQLYGAILRYGGKGKRKGQEVTVQSGKNCRLLV